MSILQQLRDIYQFNTRRRDRWIAAQAARIPKGSRVLDAGAGEGNYRSMFGHCQYFTQDFAQEASMMGRYTKLDYISDITALPIPDASFDVVVCTEVIEHIPEPILALKEFSRVLRVGGKLILTAPLGSRLHQRPFHFYGGYTPYWYGRFLPSAGFAIEEIERNRGFFSLFGQEALRFSALIDPRHTSQLGIASRFAVTLIWIATIVFMRIVFPLVAPFLDSLTLEDDATIGYHVLAVRK